MTDAAPDVSILIPVFNTARFLPRALDSVLGQTHRNLEVIAIDDASPDNAYELLVQRQKEDPRLKIVQHATNKGTAEARRSGVKAAAGKYILCLDADDTFDSNTVEFLLSTAEKHSADIVGFGARELTSDGKNLPYGNTLDSTPFHLSGKAVFEALIREHFYSWSLCLKLIRRELFLKACDEMPSAYCVFAEDFMYFIPIAFYARKLVMSGKILYNYYQEIGITRTGTISLSSFQRSASMLNAFSSVRNFLNRHELFPSFENAFRLRMEEQLKMLWEKYKNLANEEKSAAFDFVAEQIGADKLQALFTKYAESPAPEQPSWKHWLKTESFVWKLLKRMQGVLKIYRAKRSGFHDK